MFEELGQNSLLEEILSEIKIRDIFFSSEKNKMPKGLFIFILLFLLPNCKKKCNMFEDPSEIIYGIDISQYQDYEKITGNF